MKALLIFGLALTFLGAVVQSWRDLRGQRVTWNRLGRSAEERQRSALLGFPLIALGTALQAVAVFLD